MAMAEADLHTHSSVAQTIIDYMHHWNSLSHNNSSMYSPAETTVIAMMRHGSTVQPQLQFSLKIIVQLWKKRISCDDATDIIIAHERL